ncbi:unnamed protein product [Ectocarpus sp. 12 AP-2014]
MNKSLETWKTPTVEFASGLNEMRAPHIVLTRECAPLNADAPIIAHHEPTHLQFDPWINSRQLAVDRRPSSKTCTSRPQYQSVPSNCQASAALDSKVPRCS